MSNATEEEMSVTLGIRVTPSLRDRLEKVQEDHKKSSGFEPSLSDVVRMFVEKGLTELDAKQAAEKKRGR
jgi:hypothetical protein